MAGGLHGAPNSFSTRRATQGPPERPCYPPRIGNRTTDTRIPTALESAAQYIENALQNAGLPVLSQKFRAADGSEARNIEALIAGQDANAPCLVIGAHYDSIDCPGANDNASAVAALLEIAEAISRKATPKIPIRFVAFANEEPPYFGSDDMGVGFTHGNLCIKRRVSSA